MSINAEEELTTTQAGTFGVFAGSAISMVLLILVVPLSKIYVDYATKMSAIEKMEIRVDTDDLRNLLDK